MTKRVTRKQLQVSRQMTDLLMTAPLVIGQRLTRMALAGHAPSAADRRENQRMVQEKVEASMESASALMTQTARASFSFWSSMMQAGLSASSTARAQRAGMAATEASLDMARGALAPVVRRTKGNARRLARKKRP
jgi:hypothetical protein